MQQYRSTIRIAMFCFAICGFFLYALIARSEFSSIVITEIGAFETGGLEWIEIVNRGDEAIDLSGWKFWEADTNHGLNLISGTSTLQSGKYAIIAQDAEQLMEKYIISVSVFDSSWGTLSEGGERIGLKNNLGEFVEQFTYVVASDFSLERKGIMDDIYDETNWVEHPDSHTLGIANYWAGQIISDPEPSPPEAHFSYSIIPFATSTDVFFDASTSVDPDEDMILFQWNFGDSAQASGLTSTHKFSVVSSTVELLVSDATGLEHSTSSIFQFSHSTEIIPEPVPDVPTSTPSIILSEIYPNADGLEWVELYNSATSSVSLEGYTIADSVGEVAAPTSTIGPESFVVIELPQPKLNNDGDHVRLFFEGVLIDDMCYGSLDGLSCVELLSTKEESFIYHNGWNLTTVITKEAENIFVPRVVEDPDPPPASNPSSGSGASIPSIPVQTVAVGDVLINEFVSDPADNYDEFIELYNKSTKTIFLDGWWIEDGSETKTNVSGSIQAKNFLVVDTPKGKLNNSGDYIALFSERGVLIDDVTYGSWQNGELENNAPLASDPYSVARREDGKDSQIDARDFTLTATITKGAKNIISTLDTTEEVVDFDSGHILLSEVFPNPVGSDSDDEFIEIYNAGETTQQLEGFILGDASSRRYTIGQLVLEPGEYHAFSRSETHIALNNSGEEIVTIYTPEEQVVDSVVYTHKVLEGESFVLVDGVWKWSMESSKGKENIVVLADSIPHILFTAPLQVAKHREVIFDASDSFDDQGSALFFEWRLFDKTICTEDVCRYAFNIIGEQKMTLIVRSDSGAVAQTTFSLTVEDPFFMLETEDAGDIRDIFITEYVSDPEGSDTQEFIELYNPTPNDISLAGFYLDDMEGGSRPYKFIENTVIPAESYLVFDREDTKIALNNTVDAVRILDEQKQVIQEVHYEDTQEAVSAILFEGEWKRSLVQTPGAENIWVPAIIQSEKKTIQKKQATALIYTTLDVVRHEDIGDRVSVRGIVSVLPGVLGGQFFYIVAPNGENSGGIQVYMYSKDFPAFSVGDRVEIQGELSEAYGEVRIKTKEQGDIQKIDHPGDPEVVLADIADIGELLEGQLVRISGEVTEVKSSYLYVDDGTEEIKVYMKRGAGIDLAGITEGDLVNISGIVSEKKGVFQLLPRGNFDVVKTGVAKTIIQDKQIESEAQKDKEVAEKYLTATAGGLTSLLFALLAKTHGSTAWRFVTKLTGSIYQLRKKR
ncbi:lamin tail domain-containing protein [Patescibacteria group bacterium]|nr:lamin tail domain-containing protein [Patescibacteria group bacterium]MBU1721277.1 lamin tail domain-containing protein [Patescibacteria group bacterium]MBU1901015.1 lamin tail domain-containing protein [Patescibacteria group bacterium]